MLAMPVPYFGSVFKYREIGIPESDSRRRLKQIIVDNSIWVPRPSTLNDPFDCMVALDVGDVEVLKKHYESKLSNSSLSISERQAKVENAIANDQNPYVRAQIAKRTMDKRIAVLSFSERQDSVTQWAYYAGNHTGVCLEFQIIEDTPWWGGRKAPADHPGGKWCGWPVNYCDERVVMKLSDAYSNPELATAYIATTVTTKANEWAHENEIRVLSNKSGLLQFRREALAAVTLGANVSQEQEDFVRNCVLESGQKLKIRTSIPDLNEARLVIR